MRQGAVSAKCTEKTTDAVTLARVCILSYRCFPFELTRVFVSAVGRAADTRPRQRRAR